MGKKTKDFLQFLHCFSQCFIFFSLEHVCIVVFFSGVGVGLGSRESERLQIQERDKIT